MKKYISVIVAFILKILRDILGTVKIGELRKEITEQEQRTKEVKNDAKEAYDDFKSTYDSYLAERLKITDVRRGTEEVRNDGGTTKKSDS